MASREKSPNELEHLPARSGTPAAWMALGLLTLLLACTIFFNTLVCATLRGGLTLLAWNQKTHLTLDRLTLGDAGRITAEGLTLTFGPEHHRSIIKSDKVEIQPASIITWLGFGKEKKARFLHQVVLGKTKVLADRRTSPRGSNSKDERRELPRWEIPWISLLPDAFTSGPMDVVIIGNNQRIAFDGLRVFLPDRWSGRLSYGAAMIDLGAAHRQFGSASAPASWNGTTLRVGLLELSQELNLEELTISPRPEKLEFGLRGLLGGGLLRGDGALALNNTTPQLAVTLVGENLRAEALTHLFWQETPQVTGTIRQGRITFRGDPTAPLESDSSLRLVADDFRWEGRGWDTLRLAATLTGRICNLSELVILQKDNEVVAQGQSKLPADWHEALRAPFTASFHARLQDAGALAALAGPDFAQLSGGLDLEGALKGAENKAEGYCNIVGSEMKVRNLPVDWLKGCLLFEGEKTRLSSLEIWSGKDRVVLEGGVENSRPHNYKATAQFDIANLTKRLSQIGISTASQIGGGAVRGVWNGDGREKSHSGTFYASVNSWVSPWTSAGMSGNFEGSYSPGHLYLSKAEFQSEDLRLGLQLAASPTRLEAKSIIATKKGRSAPVVQGDISVPVNAPALWQNGALVANLAMKDQLALNLEFHGIKVEELAELLGQKTPCSGTLAGNLKAGGTPELPEIHALLKMDDLALPGSAAAGSLSLSLESINGRLVSQLSQGSALNLSADLPFRLEATDGSLHFAEPTAPVNGQATFHAFPVDGWLSLLGETSFKLRDGLIEGSMTGSGNLSKPLLKGNLEFTAREISLPGLPPLGSVKLPFNFTDNKALSGGGSALLGTNPLALAGQYDWSNTSGTGSSATINISGGNLPLPFFGGFDGLGDAAFTLTFLGSKAPVLSGSLIVKHLNTPLLSTVAPSFVPPGFMLTSALPQFAPTIEPKAAALDLQVRTEGTIPVTPAGATTKDDASLQADLHLRGTASAPAWTGALILRNGFLDLPAGRFYLPEATLRADTAGEEQLSFAATGLTEKGFTTLQHDGSVEHGVLSAELLTAAPSTTADAVLALATSTQTGVAALSQLLAWNRQNQLFPSPSVPWISHREGSPDWGALGFYGRPWSALLTTKAAAVRPTAPKEKRRTN